MYSALKITPTQCPQTPEICPKNSENPDKIGVFYGNIFFVAALCVCFTKSRVLDSVFDKISRFYNPIPHRRSKLLYLKIPKLSTFQTAVSIIY